MIISTGTRVPPWMQRGPFKACALASQPETRIPTTVLPLASKMPSIQQNPGDPQFSPLNDAAMAMYTLALPGLQEDRGGIGEETEQTQL